MLIKFYHFYFVFGVYERFKNYLQKAKYVCKELKYIWVYWRVGMWEGWDFWEPDAGETGAGLLM